MDIVIRAAVAYVFIIFLLRIIGRRELSTLGPSDLVLLVVMATSSRPASRNPISR